uniref:Uncharacterized protein n=1 Tax=Russula lepida TaxID=152963 RepID=A0A2S0U3Y4_9AGAM|nr:hypothetical protein [Russula lepida]AWB36195.1 hypothetical protein [Russula lepida]
MIEVLLLIIFGLSLVYIYFGLFTLIQILIWIVVFFLSNFLLGINPEEKKFLWIKLFSVLTIMFIIYWNSTVVNVSSMLILPVSIKGVTYFDDVKSSHIDSKTELAMFNLFDLDQISNFIERLDNDYNYMLNIEFSPLMTEYNYLDAPQLILSRPLVINRFSSPATIFEFINRRLFYMVDYYYLDDFILQQSKDGPVLIFKSFIRNLKSLIIIIFLTILNIKSNL